MAFNPADGRSRTLDGFEQPDALIRLEVDGIDALGSEVDGASSVDQMATDIADQVESHTSSPDYGARAVANRVFIVAPVAGIEYNGLSLEIETLGEVKLADVLSLTGGIDTDTLDASASEPGQFVKTYGSKMYTLSGPVLHFSGIGQPTIFNTEATGAGFIDMTTFSSGSEKLTAVENYFGRMAVFSENIVQIWTLDPDPDQNQQEQVVRNVGTRSPHSVMQVGEMDLFFLDDTGIMTLRPHGVTTEAQAENASLPIDDVVLEAMKDAGLAGVERAIAMVEPKTKRFWMAIGHKIFVLSRYPGAKIAAWSVYELFGGDITDMVAFDGLVYVRQGNNIQVYGGTDGETYDDAAVTVRIPYLDAQRPADWKMWDELNLASEGGTWTVTIYTDPDSTEEEDAPVDIEGVSYGKRRVPLQANSSHISLKLVHEDSGYARISNLAVHYESSESG